MILLTNSMAQAPCSSSRRPTSRNSTLSASTWHLPRLHTPTREGTETPVHEDLNAYAVIGVPPTTTTIESYGSTALVQSGSNYFMNPVAGGSGPELERSGAPFTSGEFGARTPIGAEV